MPETLLARLADGRTDLVFDWVAEGRSATATDAGGRRLIERCACYGDVSAVREEAIDLLLAAGARHDACDANGDTPLGWASCYGRPDPILRKLLHGEHRIHPDRRPMAASLLGWPRGGGG